MKTESIMPSSDAAPIITITSAVKKFGTVTALQDINLSVRDGEILTLLGPSGCGKTTLMRLIAGFEDVTSGSLCIGGENMAKVPPERRPVNMVFQRYALFPHLDIFENVAYGLRVRKVPKAEIRERVTRMLKIVQLDAFSHRYIDQISGGQSQRVALARALVNRPKVLLLDEPLAALDLKIRQHMLLEMKGIHTETGATFVYVTHDQDEAMILSDRVVLMDQGRIVQIDRPEQMYARPNSLFAAKFLGEINLIGATLERAGPDGSAVAPGGVRFKGAAPQDLASGSPVTVALRPEAMSFSSPLPEQPSLPGTVESIVFIGSRSLFTVRLDSGDRARVQIQRNWHQTLPAEGDRVSVFWDERSVVLLKAQ